MNRQRISLMMALAFAVAFGARAELDRSTIVAAWTFEEGGGNQIDDVSEYGNHGEITGAPTWTDGVFGKALDFNGSSDWVVVPHDDSLNLNEMTVAAWVNIRSYPDDARIISKELGVNDPWSIYSFMMSGDGESKVEFRPTLNGTRQRIPSVSDAPLNRWTHVAATYDGSTVVIYLDGEADVEQAFSGEMMVNEEPVYIGASQFWEPRMFDGLMDDGALFNVALAQADIRELMDVGLIDTLAVDARGKLATTWGTLKR